MKFRSLALVALTLLPLFPIANAAGPTATAWSPYDAKVDVNAIALASAGTTIAAATAQPVTVPASPGVPGLPDLGPGAPPGDLAILDAAKGFAYNGSGSTTPLGRSHVAVSADGTTIVSLGRDASANPGGILGGANNGQLKLYYQRVENGVFLADTSATNYSAFVAGNATDVLVSADGTRVAYATNDNDKFTVAGYTLSGSSLLNQFAYTANGHVYDISGTSDLGTIVVGAQIPEGNDTHAALYTIPFSSGQPLASQSAFDRTVNGSSFRSVGIAANGARIVAGDALGHVRVYDASVANAVFVQMPGAAVNVTRLAVSNDGRRVAATTSDGALVMLDTTLNPRILWNATIAGKITSLSMNASGGMIVISVNGTDGGVRAYGDHAPTPLWTTSGNANGAAINANGTLVAYATSTKILAAALPRSIQVLFPGNTKLSTSHTIKPLGTATVDVQVTNQGAGLERVAFSMGPGLDLALATDPARAVVAPGETQNVTLLFTAGRSYAGSHTFNVTGRSLSSNATDDVTVVLSPQLTSSVSLVLNGSDQIAVAAGIPVQVLLGVVNNGTRDAAVGLRARQSVTPGSELWNVTIEPASMNLAPNSITSVRVTVTAPEHAANGTSDDVFFDLEGPNVTDSTHVTFRINPTVGVSIDADARTRFVQPGQTAYYNVTVLNNGSLPRQYVAFFQVGNAEGGKSWGVDMDTNAFLLQPGKARTLPVRIFAPGDATPTDRVSVLVRARTITQDPNETAVEANLTLFANAIPRVTTTTPTSGRLIPLADVSVVLGMLSLVTIVLRPRRRQP